MQFEEFSKSIKDDKAPAALNPYALSLWHDAKGNWASAHTIIQDIEDKTAAWIHAYLHRKEGDAGNAGYWYSRAHKTMPDYALDKEWEEIVKAVL
ncbi:MAG: hypothetical protein ABIQ88_05165 [Chitinophagaceae bacterium]